MFKTGDKVIHDFHGVGVIERIEEMEVLGQLRQYFVVNITQKKMTVMVPVEKCEEVGLRRISKAAILDEVFDVLKRRDVKAVPEKWNQRYKDNIDKLKTGNVVEVAAVLKSLTAKEKKNGLSMSDMAMLKNVRQNLAGEIALSKRINIEKAYIMMDSYIN
jgi:CarD family transcriptional regulator